MNEVLFDSEVTTNDRFGYVQESEYYSEDVGNYYDESGEAEDYYAGEEYYSEEQDAASTEHSLAYYNAQAAQAARAKAAHAARVRAAQAAQARAAHVARVRAAQAARARAAHAARVRAARAEAARRKYRYAGSPPLVPRYRHRPPSGFPPSPIVSQAASPIPSEPRDFPPAPMEPTDFPMEPLDPTAMEPSDFPAEPTDLPSEPMEPSAMEPGDFPDIPMEPEDFAATDVELGEEEMWFDEAEETVELAEALREVMHEGYKDATPEEMQEALFNVLGKMTPAESINFGKVLRQIGQAGKKILDDPTVAQIAQAVLPAAGATVGTVAGGPIGTAVGGTLGQAAVQAFPGARTTNTPAAAAAPPSPTSPQSGSAAAEQLLQLTQNPDVLKSLSSLALGSLGNMNVKLGNDGQLVPVGGIMNLIGTLAGKAAADADELLRGSEFSPSYMLDEEGQFLGDPATPEDRAQALYHALSEAENLRIIQ